MRFKKTDPSEKRKKNWFRCNDSYINLLFECYNSKRVQKEKEGRKSLGNTKYKIL